MPDVTQCVHVVLAVGLLVEQGKLSLAGLPIRAIN